jgi:hypothetical protein
VWAITETGLDGVVAGDGGCMEHAGFPGREARIHLGLRMYKCRVESEEWWSVRGEKGRLRKVKNKKTTTD